MQLNWSLEAASFAAALAVGSVVQLFQERIGVSRNILDVAGCMTVAPRDDGSKRPSNDASAV